MKMKKVLDSFNNAINGIIDTVRTERNMKIHLIVSLFILIGCFFFDVTKYEFLILAVTISMVISAEIVNTAIEAAIDMTTNYYHPLAKSCKKCSSRCCAGNSHKCSCSWVYIFWDKLSNLSYTLVKRVKTSEPYTIFIVLVIVCIANNNS